MCSLSFIHVPFEVLRVKALKDKGKGKGRVGPIPQSRVSNPGTVGIVPPSEGEDSAASFQGPMGLNEH